MIYFQGEEEDMITKESDDSFNFVLLFGIKEWKKKREENVFY